jgi:hypothetical protein
MNLNEVQRPKAKSPYLSFEAAGDERNIGSQANRAQLRDGYESEWRGSGDALRGRAGHRQQAPPRCRQMLSMPSGDQQHRRLKYTQPGSGLSHDHHENARPGNGRPSIVAPGYL